MKVNEFQTITDRATVSRWLDKPLWGSVECAVARLTGLRGGVQPTATPAVPLAVPELDALTNRPTPNGQKDSK